MGKLIDLTGLQHYHKHLTEDVLSGYVTSAGLATAITSLGKVLQFAGTTSGKPSYDSTKDKDGMVKIDSTTGKEYVCYNSGWIELGDESSFVVKNASTSEGTACKVTYDAQGLVISGTGLAASDIPVLDSNKITTLTDYKLQTSAASAIAVNDSLNTALSKLEKGVAEAKAAAASANTDTKVTSAENHYGYAAGNAGTTGSATSAAVAFGGTVITGITLDAANHVTSIQTGAIPANPNTDTKVTSAANHYAPAEDTTVALNASGASATDITNGSGVQVVTGLKRDAKGHVVGVVSASLKSTDTNTDTKVTSAANHYGYAASSGTTTGSNATGTLAFGNEVITGITLDDAKHVTAIYKRALPANPNTNTTYTFAEGSKVGAFSVTPSGGSAQSVQIHGFDGIATNAEIDTAFGWSD